MNAPVEPVLINTRLLSSCSHVVAGALLVTLVFLFGVTPTMAGQTQRTADDENAGLIDDGELEQQETDSAADTSDAKEPETDSPDDRSKATDLKPSRESALRIPASLPDGRPLRSIWLYQSQIDELIPDHYLPVSIDRLNKAVSLLTGQATFDESSRVKGAVYWVEVVDDTLVSDHSVIEIESDLHTQIRRSLGKVNLAIEQPKNRGAAMAINALPRLESESDGNLVAVLRGGAQAGTEIEFKWRLRGKALGFGHEFTMRLPRTPQTRIVLSVPANLTIESYDGVLRSRPGPPPDAIEFVTDRELLWYELDAGGLASVRIRTQQKRPTSDGENFVIRRSSVQYKAEPSGLTWTSRMAVQLARESQFPPLAVSGTTITAVKVDGNNVPFSSKTIGGRVRHLQIDSAKGLVSSQDVSVDVTVTGHTTWSGKNGWCDLPMPIWMGEGVVHASTVDDVQLDVDDLLQVEAWQLPSDWKQASQQSLEDGTTLYAADGPPVALLGLADQKNSSSSPTAGRNWSRVRFINRPRLKSSDTMLRLEVSAGSLAAKARIAVKVDPSRVEPLRLRVERGWSLDTVAFAHSGRVIEHPAISENSRVLVLWPEAEDANEAEIVIEVSGTRLLPGTSPGLVIPPCWFVRTLGVRGDLIAAIVPPKDLNWSGEAAMQRGRITFSQLTDSQRNFFSGLDQDSLWFHPETARTPLVSLQKPSVSFNAATEFQIWRDSDGVSEYLVIEIKSEAQGLRQLAVQTGPPRGRPVLRWSISGSNDSPSTSLPSSDVTIGEGENEGTYTIDVSDKNLRGRRLIARRRYPLEQQLQLQLPSVSGAASQSSDVVVGPGLLVKQKSRAVQLVPFGRRDVQPSLSESLPQLGESNQDATGGFIRLRYDAVEQPSMTLKMSNVNPNVTIVWREQIQVIASSRGTDRVEATYKVSPTASLEIDYDPELQLVSVSRDGEPVDLNSIPQRPQIVLHPRSETETIHIKWNRSQYGWKWMRQCRIPRIIVSGTVLKSEYELISASDTFAPAALFRGQVTGVGRVNLVEMRPGENVTLIRRNTALAIGWLFALLVFALSWFVAERAPLVIAASVVVATALLLLWWPWRLAVIGWLIVPIVAAAMHATSRAWRDRENQLENPSDQEASSGAHSMAEDHSADFSLESVARLMLIPLVATGFVSAVVTAQDASDQQPTSTPLAAGPVDVLVPVNKDGALSGDMIYIPGSVYAELFQTTTKTKPQDARFQSASYHVKIDPTTTQNDQIVRAIVEAEFLIHVQDGDRSTNFVRLPLDSASVRHIKLIDDVDRIVHFTAESSNQVIATLPKGNAFRLRVTSSPAVSESDQWRKLVLSIPPVAASRLTVEAERNIDAIRVGGAAGRLLSETGLHRWVEELGPVDSLEIDFRTLDSATSADVKQLQRRYWINAGKRQLTIDCEVNPPNAIAAGESFQFVVRDSDDMPHLTSSAWRLDGTEEYSSTRRLITVTGTRDSPGPIRLLWTRPSMLNRDGNLDPVTIKIPEVIAAEQGKNSPAWIALHCDSDLQFAPLNMETLSVDHFLAAWSGYGEHIDRAYVSLGKIPSPMLQIKVGSEPIVSQRHHLHVMPNRLELHYTATLTPSDLTRNLYVLRFPRGLDLIRVVANDQELDGPPIRSGDSSEILLGSFVGLEPVTISVIAVQQLPTNLPFAPPRLAILPVASTSDVYVVSRDRSRQLRVTEAPLIEPVASEQTATADSLARGWIPFATWTFESTGDSDQRDLPGGLYEVKERQTRFDCRQIIALMRDDGRWTMETLVRFKSSVIPDFIDVEVPTRWCGSLEVSPPTAWSQHPATDPSRQIVRIPCNDEEFDGETLSIRGQLENSETGRVSVPSVRVLGSGQRQTHISVPAQLTNEPIQWRTSAVEAVRLPRQWNGLVAQAQRSTYLVANPSWSIDLAPLLEIDVDAVSVNSDTQVFAQNDGVLVVCHWDLFPGGLETIDVQLPNRAICLGAWSAGQAVVAEPLESDAEENLLRVPLALSRLSQPVELLIRVPASKAKQASYLPELVGVPVIQKWLTNYVPADSIPNSSQADLSLRRERAVALARSVVDAVDRIDMVAERPRDEVADWLELWVSRYRMIAASVGHVVDFELRTETLDQIGTTQSPGTPSDAAQRLSLPSHLQWRHLDSRMAVYANRFLSDGPGENSFIFGVGGFDGFVAHRVARLSAVDRPRSVQPVSTSDRGLRDLIVNALTLVLVCGLLGCLRPLRRWAMPVVVHPAFWLGLMGIFGFVVAPAPVAAAILLVAVSLPVFPSKRWSWGGRVR